MLFRVMRIAFEEERTVAFDCRHERVAFFSLPKHGSYECWRYKSSTGTVSGDLDLLKDLEVFLLVNPRGKATGIEPPINVVAATLIAASSIPAPYQQFVKKRHSKKYIWPTGRRMSCLLFEVQRAYSFHGTGPQAFR
jgi:hypothetical protein